MRIELFTLCASLALLGCSSSYGEGDTAPQTTAPTPPNCVDPNCFLTCDWRDRDNMSCETVEAGPECEKRCCVSKPSFIPAPSAHCYTLSVAGNEACDTAAGYSYGLCYDPAMVCVLYGCSVTH